MSFLRSTFYGDSRTTRITTVIPASKASQESDFIITKHSHFLDSGQAGMTVFVDSI